MSYEKQPKKEESQSKHEQTPLSSPPSDADSKLKKPTFNSALRGGPHHVLGKLLSREPLLNLTKTNSENKELYKIFLKDAVYKEQLHRIGPDVARLINEGETPRQAYERHQQQIAKVKAALPALKLEIVKTYPDYYPNTIIGDELFAKWTEDPQMLSYLCKLNDINIGPVMEYILSNDQEFARIIPNIDNLYLLNLHIPEYIDRAVERILTNEVDFIRVIGDNKNSKEFKKFIKDFPAYEERATALMGKKNLEDKKSDIPPMSNSSHSFSSNSVSASSSEPQPASAPMTGFK